MKAILVLLAMGISPSALAAEPSTISIPRVASVAFGDVRTLQEIQEISEKYGASIDVTKIESYEFAPNRHYVCIQLQDIGSDYSRHLGFVRAEVKAQLLGGRGGVEVGVMALESGDRVPGCTL
ncbi:MAG: hypothetical protein AB7G93_16735 [Bdellovibrionales bacterium]